jgi:hypothetical protein
MNQWIWENQLTNFSDFTNWNGAEGVGCAPACIYDKNRMYMKYPSGKWVATVQTTPLPYVCASNCALGYVWRQESRKCVLIVNAEYSFTEAEVACSLDNGQLAKVSLCHDFYALGRDLWWVSQDTSRTYWIGYYDTGTYFKANDSLEMVLQKFLLCLD